MVAAMPDDGSESPGGEAGLRGAPIDKLPLERRLLFCDEASSISVELARVDDTNRPSERESVFLRKDSSSSTLGRALTIVSGRVQFSLCDTDVDSGRVIPALQPRHPVIADSEAGPARAPCGSARCSVGGRVQCWRRVCGAYVLV